MFVGLIIIILVASGAFTQENGNNENGLSSPTQHTVVVASGSLNVDSNSHTFISFSVPSGASNVVLEGNFTASGGSGNDIKVYVMDPTNYGHWTKGQQAFVSYSSGQTTSGNISASLPSIAGTYYLVFDNIFSLQSSKIITAQAILTYIK